VADHDAEHENAQRFLFYRPARGNKMRKMRSIKTKFSVILCASLLGVLFQASSYAQQSKGELSLEQIMANPDWMGIAPDRSYFSADGKNIYFVRKAPNSELRDLYKVDIAGKSTTKLDAAETAMAESEQRVYSPDRSQTVWLRNGNLFVLRDGKKHQITRTGDVSGLLGFIGNEQIALRNEGKVVLLNLRNGEQNLLVNLKNDDDPNVKKAASDYLSLQQTRLFEIIKKREKNKTDAEARQREMAQQTASPPAPIYLGKGREFNTFSLSPDGHHLLVGTVAPKLDGRADKMPHYVSADGYVKVEEVRSKVGNDQAFDETLYLVDIGANKASKLMTDKLAGINEDPLLTLKIDAAKRLGKPEPKAAVPRAVYVNGPRAIRWSGDSQRLAFALMSYDNKDRWIVDLDLQASGEQKTALHLMHRLTDPAWVNDGGFNELGWQADSKSLWYLSEESGYSNLYTNHNGKVNSVVQGKFEVSQVQMTRDGKWFYYRANKKHPGIYEVYRVSVDGQRDEALTNMNGGIDYELAPAEDRLLLTQSTSTRQADLYVKAVSADAAPVKLTQSNSEAFSKIDWIKPEIIAVPSKHGAAPIYSRVYRSADTQQGERKPAVMFVHGAGYLQAAHHGWSTYFREMMFHNLLVQQGYVVIDMDYRASAGYGRDWRTAIYQRMGTPELEDYLDGLDWLVDKANVDKNRVGIYGGSYGGFMTFMALFKTDAFAAGAALRPVADWAHYNHGYTSNILNTPDVDPDAYLRSSPIEFAAGLKRPLLICHGMVDDNVFFEDTVRIVQKLIELKNPNFDLAVYPVEAHGFREPESWLDEYRRIYKLMEREVKGRKTIQ
jgi:dipeptidyl aminopeptidase/acylaminoacyl peptidase